MHLGSSAAEVPLKLQSDTTIFNQIARLRDFTRFGGNIPYRLVNRGPTCRMIWSIFDVLIGTFLWISVGGLLSTDVDVPTFSKFNYLTETIGLWMPNGPWNVWFVTKTESKIKLTQLRPFLRASLDIGRNVLSSVLECMILKLSVLIIRLPQFNTHIPACIAINSWSFNSADFIFHARIS